MSENRIVVIAGFRGSGKTTLASYLLRKQAGILVYDPNEDPAYDFIPNTVYSLHGEKKSLAQFLSWVAREKKSRFAVRYIPEEEETGTLFEDANEFCRLAWRTFGTWVCFEEVHQIANTPSPSSMPPQFRKLINRGRHQRVSVLVTGLRYAEIPRPVTAGADLHVVFRTSEPLDTEELRKRIGFEAADEVTRLAEHQALVFDVSTRRWFICDSRGEILSEERGSGASLVSGGGGIAETLQ